MSNPKALVTKWQALLEAEGVPAIATASKKKIVARILEEQEKDLANMGFLPKGDWQAIQEAEVSGNADGAFSGDVATDIAAGANSGAIVYHGPTVMGIVRRAIPQMMAFDTVGVQPLTQPTGQIFAIRSIYGDDWGKNAADAAELNGKEAFYPGAEPRRGYSGDTSGQSGVTVLAGGVVKGGVGDVATAESALPAATPAVGDVVGYRAQPAGAGTYIKQTRYYRIASTSGLSAWTDLDTDTEVNAAIAANKLIEIGAGLVTSLAEVQESFNGTSGNAWNEMSFRIDKQGVEAKSRQLKAQYSIELAQDLRAVHGLDADTELSNILANEIMVEINRELVVTMNVQAQTGKTGKTAGEAGTVDGVFDYSDAGDTKGARWAGEKYKAILIQIEKEANEIGRQTGRGNGNFILASRNVVSALTMTDAFISWGQQGLQAGLQTDTNNSVFAGVLGGRFKVFIDQYAVDEYFLVGFKGGNEMEAGIFYSPYVPLTPLRGQDPKNMQPVLAFKTRYGLSINPFVQPENSQIFSNSLARGIGANQYYRRVLVKGL